MAHFSPTPAMNMVVNMVTSVTILMWSDFGALSPVRSHLGKKVVRCLVHLRNDPFLLLLIGFSTFLLLLLVIWSILAVIAIWMRQFIVVTVSTFM